VPTPSGKSSFTLRLSPRRVWTRSRLRPPTESRWSKGAERYPLEFLSRKADNYMNSTFANLDGHRKMEARKSHKLEMHPTDAQSRGIADGESVRVFNDRGSLRLTAYVNGSLPPGVVAAQLDWPNSATTTLTSMRSPASGSRTSRGSHLLFNAC